MAPRLPLTALADRLYRLDSTDLDEIAGSAEHFTKIAAAERDFALAHLLRLVLQATEENTAALNRQSQLLAGWRKEQAAQAKAERQRLSHIADLLEDESDDADDDADDADDHADESRDDLDDADEDDEGPDLDVDEGEGEGEAPPGGGADSAATTANRRTRSSATSAKPDKPAKSPKGKRSKPDPVAAEVVGELPDGGGPDFGHPQATEE